MNYSINQTQETCIITVYDVPRANQKDFVELERKNQTNNLQLAKLMKEAEQRRIQVYELNVLKANEKEASSNRIDAYFYYNSCKDSIGRITINQSISDSEKKHALLFILCLEKVFNKYWYLYIRGNADTRREFNDKVNKQISKMMRQIGKAKSKIELQVS